MASLAFILTETPTTATIAVSHRSSDSVTRSILRAAKRAAAHRADLPAFAMRLGWESTLVAFAATETEAEAALNGLPLPDGAVAA